MNNEDILNEMKECQQQTHQWGRENQVTFDEAKEEFVVLHRSSGSGSEFRLLGPWVDNKLLMHTAVNKIMAKARPKIKALLRTAPYYNAVSMVNQFKTHVLPILESATGAIYHAAASTKLPMERAQTSFLSALSLSPEEAFLEMRYNLAPLTLRSDIAMLGVLHKCARGVAHPAFLRLFPLAPSERPHSHERRWQNQKHSHQLVERCQGHHSEILARSMFGVVRSYNRLPQHIVDNKDVSKFQSALTEAARKQCRDNSRNWSTMYSPSTCY